MLGNVGGKGFFQVFIDLCDSIELGGSSRYCSYGTESSTWNVCPRNLEEPRCQSQHRLDWLTMGRSSFGREQAATVGTPHHANRTHLPAEHFFILLMVYISIILGTKQDSFRG